MNTPMTILDQLETVRSEWEEVHAASRLESPFLTIEYLQLWYTCFAQPDQVRIYKAVHDGDTIGFLPLVLRSKGPLRVLSSLTNDHCLHSEALVRKGFESEFPRAIMRALHGDAGSWDLLRYSFSNSYSATPGLFPATLLAGCGVHWRQDAQPTFVVALDKPYDDYYRGDLSPKFRKNIKMYRKRLERVGRAELLHLRGAEAVERWPDFVRIEGSGWKGRAGSSINNLESNFKRYYEGLVALLARQDALHLYILQIDDEPIAAAFCYCEGELFHYAKIGFLEEYGSLSPSNLLFLDIVKDLRENHPEISAVHLFPWSGGYKHRFANRDADCFETTLYGRGWRGALIRSAHRSKEGLRRIPGLPSLARLAKRLLRRGS